MPDDVPLLGEDSRPLVDTVIRQKLEMALGSVLPMPPPGYRYTGDSLYVELARGPVNVSSLIFIAAHGYNAELDSWSVRLVFLNHFGDPVVLDIPS